MEITNYKGAKNLSVDDLPFELFPPQKTKFINDLEACCYGILYLNHDSKLQEYFVPAFSPNNDVAYVTQQFIIFFLQFCNNEYTFVSHILQC